MIRVIDIFLIFLISFISCQLLNNSLTLQNFNAQLSLFPSYIILFSLIAILSTYRYIKNICKKIYLFSKFEWVNGITLGVISYLFINGKYPINIILTIIYSSTLIIYFLYIRKINLKKYNPEISNFQSDIYFKLIKNPHALTSLDGDEFDRSEIVKKISDLINTNSQCNLTIGINGPWGMGKTSLINFIRKNINAEDNEIVFSAWEYRDSNRFVEIMLNKIGRKIDNLTGNFNFFSKLFKKVLIKVSDDGRSFLSGKMGFNFNIEFNIKDIKNEIKEKINTEKFNQLIIYIDDLDRLERSELINVLKAINMISDIPKIRFVLAYDKKNLYDSLFQKDLNKSIDYFSKIVQCEINLSVPPSHIRKKILLKIIKELQENTNYIELAIFYEFTNDNHLTYHLFQLLQTPRELRKIIAFSIWISLNHNKGKNFDFVDMLILTTFQYKAPPLYAILQNDSEQIINELCSGTQIRPMYPEALLTKIKQKKHTRNGNQEDAKYGEEIIKRIKNENKEIFEDLLKYLLPPLFNEVVNQEQILLNKKMCHPLIYHSYFQYTYWNYSDDYLEILNKMKRLAQNNEKVEKYCDFLIENREILFNDWLWNLLISSCSDSENNLTTFLKAIFLISKKLEYSKENHFDSELSLYSHRSFSTLYSIRNEKDFTAILTFLQNPILEIRYGLFAYNIKAITNPEFFSLTKTIRLDSIENERLNADLTQFAKKYFKGRLLNSFIFYDFIGLLCWTELDNELVTYILESINEENEVFFNILDIYCNSMSNKLKELDIKLNYQKLYALIDKKIKNGSFIVDTIPTKYQQSFEEFWSYQNK